MARFLFERPVPRRYIIGGLFVLPLGICVCGGVRIATCLAKGNSVAWTMLNWRSTYDAPHIWLFAILIVMLFAWHLNFPEKVKKACTFMGPSMFGVYLLHDVMHNGRLIYRIPQEWLHSYGLPPIICIFLTAITTFVFCIIIDLCRRAAIYPAKGWAMASIDMLEMHLKMWFERQLDLSTAVGKR